MIDCYRDDSVMQHVGVAVSDGMRAVAQGEVRQAWSHWVDRRNLAGSNPHSNSLVARAAADSSARL